MGSSAADASVGADGVTDDAAASLAARAHVPAARGVGAVELHAAQALSKLARGHADNQAAIAEAGGLAPLVTLLSGDCTLLSKASEAAAKTAAIAAAQKANFIKNPAAAAAADKASKAADAAAAVAAEELRLAEGAREEAAAALWSLAAGCPANQTAVAEMRGIEPLVQLLSVGSLRAQDQVAGALGAMAHNQPENEALVCKLLVELLSTRSSSAKAARAIARLCRQHASNQAAIARAGGVSILVAQLSTAEGRGGGQMRRRTQLGGSAESSVELLREVASALWELAANHPNNQSAIAAEGGIPPLIALLSGSLEVHRDAAGALWALAASAANQAAIAEAGGIAPLVQLLAGSQHTAALETAAGALCALASLPENRDAIAAAGGIPSLVALFGGCTAEVMGPPTHPIGPHAPIGTLAHPIGPLAHPTGPLAASKSPMGYVWMPVLHPPPSRYPL